MICKAQRVTKIIEAVDRLMISKTITIFVRDRSIFKAQRANAIGRLIEALNR